MAITLERICGPCLKKPQRTVYLRKTAVSAGNKEFASTTSSSNRNDSLEFVADLNNDSDCSITTPVDSQEELLYTTPAPILSSTSAPTSLPALIEAYDIVSASKSKNFYLPLEGSEVKTDSGYDFGSVNIEYPGVALSERYPLCFTFKDDEYQPIRDLKLCVNYISSECLANIDATSVGNTQSGAIRGILKACNKKNHSALRESLEIYNVFITKVRPTTSSVPASPHLVAYILDQAYARTIAPHVACLRNYKEFSNYVYGEVKATLVTEFISKCGLKANQCFLDMGCGTGNVVLQVAAEALCESYGIEMMENPARLGVNQMKEFQARMRCYGKPCGKILLKQGDFLEDAEIHEVIKRADVIFVNNFVFDAELNQRILDRFLDLKDTAKVISLKSFAPVDRRLNNRRINAIEGIFRVKEYMYPSNSVSWTSEGGRYFIHTIRRPG